MALFKDDDCISGGKEREDRYEEAKNRFEPVRLNIRCPDTAILLLGSRERPVLVAAASALTKFAARGKENLERLFESDIIDSLVPLIDHQDLITRRFATRLLAEMAAIPFVKRYLLSSETYLPYFAKTLVRDSDTFTREYASKILAEISKDPHGAAEILRRCDEVDFLFENLDTDDPDVKKNHLEIVDNLLKDFTGADKLITSSAFDFTLVRRALDEPFLEIQSLALSVMESLVARNKDVWIQQKFAESGALRSLLDILDNRESTALWSNVLRILTLAIENSRTLENLISGGGISKLLRYFEDNKNSQEFPRILEVLVRLGNTSSGREILHGFGMVKYLLEYLRGSPRDPEISRIVCYGIGTMARCKEASREIAAENPVKEITDTAKDENLEWPVREAAMFALKELCASEGKNCENFLEINGPTYLQRTLKQNLENVPAEFKIMAIDILNCLGGYPDWRKILCETEVVESLTASFEMKGRSADEIKIASCKALSNLCVEKRTREYCLEKNFVKKLLHLLSNEESTLVRVGALQLIQQLSEDLTIAEEFVNSGYLTYMLKNRSISNIIPMWNTCIDTLFSAHLPTKFAITGSLSMREITSDGFYILRRNVCPFPILDDLLHRKLCPVETIYVINFADPRSNTILNKSRSSSIAAKNPKSNSWPEMKYGRLQKDFHLYDYMQLLKCILAANECSETIEESGGKIVNIGKIGSRAKLLGIFVARQMSGPNPQSRCIDHQLEIHVREIQEDIKTSVVPLGRLKVGSYLERAFLFKVLADRICLPATLVRGKSGKAWNEIAIPEIGNPVEDQTIHNSPEVLDEDNNAGKNSLPVTNRRKSLDSDDADKIHVVDDNLKSVLPKSLLRENYIVDLMENPGDLIPIDSPGAKIYCGSMTPSAMSCIL